MEIAFFGEILDRGLCLVDRTKFWVNLAIASQTLDDQDAKDGSHAAQPDRVAHNV